MYRMKGHNALTPNFAGLKALPENMKDNRNCILDTKFHMHRQGFSELQCLPHVSVLISLNELRSLPLEPVQKSELLY